jgi:pimeloyl-ACP methyl ester carboxylesterase
MEITAQVYSDDSDKPVLALIHGLGSGASIWKSLIPDLVKDFKVLAIDLPGHGDTPLLEKNHLDPRSLAQAIVNYMEDEHEISEFHVAGNSLGGWIALEMAAIASARSKSVTALAPAGLWQTGPTSYLPPSLDSRILAKISQFFMPIAYHLPPLKALGYKKITHLWQELSYESCRDSVIAMARSKGYMPLWQALKGHRFNSDIPESVKISVVFGDADLTLPRQVAQERSLLPPHAQWIEVENCAHVIMWNYPQLTVDFIKQTAAIAL